ncbi:MAG TPA: hypothetical protein VFA54_09975 [Bryobacterales bacterium]|nr:hypothetical protein [Bryobacterales bacterium]
MRSYFLLALILASPALAETTRTWEQSRFDEFEKGMIEHVALRSDGKLGLAPRFQEIYDAPLAYLWALARDSKGNLFAGGGPGGRVFKITPEGKKTTYFDTEALEIHSLAIDRRDNLYAATSPDSKIYKIDPSGRVSLFVDPKVKYIWAMAFNSQGDLFVATGDQGRVLRVSPSGKATVFFKTEEAHIRSLLIDKNDDLVIGTDPGGLVIRIPGSGGPGFVLYQSSKKEITALALAPDGMLYAAGVGSRGSGGVTPLAVPAAPAPAPAPVGNLLGGAPAPAGPAPAPQPASLPSSLRSGVSGGSEVFRIGLDGEPRRVWSSTEDIVYTLGFNPKGRLLIGTGNRGRVFQIEADHVYSLLVKAAPTQVTAFLQGPDGVVFAATGNIGKIYRLGPELESRGTFESEVFDAGMFAHWGRLTWTGSVPPNTSLTLYARSGNLVTPDQYWSSWSKPVTAMDGAPLDCPPARFVQWKAVLETRSGDSPLLDSVEIAYQPKNVAPTILQLEITPPNYKFADPSAASPSTQTLSLPALGSRPSTKRGSAPAAPQAPRSMNRAKGYLGARWLAEDDNNDELVYKVEIRGVKEQNWKLLRDKVEQPYISWDSTAFADGQYQLRVTASDAPSNPGPEALIYSLESEPFYIDNTPPAISGLTAAVENGRVRVRFHVADAISNIDNSEYSMDGGEWRVMLPATRLFDSKELDYDFLTDSVAGGEHTIAIRVWDSNDNLATAKALVQ